MTEVLYVVVCVVGFGATLRFARHFERTYLVAILTAGYTFVYGLVPLVAPSDHPPGVRLVAAGASLLGLVGLLAGWTLVMHRQGKNYVSPTVPISRPRARRFIALCFAIGLGSFVLGAINQAGSLSGFLAATRFEYRGEGNALVFVVSNAGTHMLLVGVLALLISHDRMMRRAGVALAIGLAFSLYVASAGTRALAIGMIGLPLLAPVFLERKRSTVKNGVRFVALGTVAVLLLVSLYEARRSLRTESPLIAVAQGVTDEENYTNLLEREPLTYSIFLHDAIELFPARHEYLWAYPLRRIVLFPLTSGGIKPENPNRIFAQLIFGNQSLGIAPPSLPGEGYITLGGLPGSLLLLAFYGVGLALLTLNQRRPVIFFAVAALAIEHSLVMLRGQLYKVTVQWFLMFGLVWATWQLSRWALGSHGAVGPIKPSQSFEFVPSAGAERESRQWYWGS